MLNQSLLDALLCFSRVVVPTARCFSSDSYAGSVISRSTDSAGRSRSQSTASRVARSNRSTVLDGRRLEVTTGSATETRRHEGTWLLRNASFYADAIVSSTIDREGHTPATHSFATKGTKNHKVLAFVIFVSVVASLSVLCGYFDQREFFSRTRRARAATSPAFRDRRGRPSSPRAGRRRSPAGACIPDRRARRSGTSGAESRTSSCATTVRLRPTRSSTRTRRHCARRSRRV